MPELPSAFGGLNIPGMQVKSGPTRIPVPKIKSETIRAVVRAVDKEIAAISDEAKRSNAKKNRDRTILSRLDAKDRKEYSEMTEDALKSKQAMMDMNPAAKDPTPKTFVGIKRSGNKKVSTLADESDILANIEAEKAAAVKAAKDKRQKAAADKAAKVQAELKKRTMALAKSISGTISGGLAKAAKRASAAPEEKPAPEVANDTAEESDDDGSESAAAASAATSGSDSSNDNNEGADEEQS
jgi:colicin import membrane protein